MAIDIYHDAWINSLLLKRVAQLANPNVLGTSAGKPKSGEFSKVILPDGASAVDIGVINALFAAFDTLSPVVDAAVIPADDTTEATITLVIADVEIHWMIIDSQQAVVGEGDAPGVGGTVTLEFKTNVSDVYEIWVCRKEGDFACGHVTITVTEV